MQKQIFLIVCLALFSQFSFAQWTSTSTTIHPTILTNTVGINTTTANARLSVNGSGQSSYGAYILSNSNVNGHTGVFGEAQGYTFNTLISNSAVGVRGIVPSGAGFTYGVRGDATAAAASSQGRAYGLYGVASNANVNFGVYGRLSGSNRGAALFAVDNVLYTNYNEIVNGTWAGYFIGNTHISDKLSIGTTETNPSIAGHNLTDYKLFVCGGILADEWLVPNVSWCDYVFEEDYELTSLKEVEQHIDAHGHLHNTPSAKEIEEKGLEVANITINQQEKIEEIYLHLIEMNKRLETLEGKNKQLETENELLKAQAKE